MAKGKEQTKTGFDKNQHSVELYDHVGDITNNELYMVMDIDSKNKSFLAMHAIHCLWHKVSFENALFVFPKRINPTLPYSKKERQELMENYEKSKNNPQLYQ